MKNEDLTWLAGYLEGEGSFLKASPSKPNMPRLRVETTDEDIAHRVAEMLGVGVTYRKPRKAHYKSCYIVTIRGQRAVEWMKRLKPHMGSRRKIQIEAACGSFDPTWRYRQGKHALTIDQAREAKGLLATGTTRKELALKYKVSYDVITSLDVGRSYMGV